MLLKVVWLGRVQKAEYISSAKRIVCNSKPAGRYGLLVVGLCFHVSCYIQFSLSFVLVNPAYDGQVPGLLDGIGLV